MGVERKVKNLLEKKRKVNITDDVIVYNLPQ